MRNAAWGCSSFWMSADPCCRGHWTVAAVALHRRKWEGALMGDAAWGCSSFWMGAAPWPAHRREGALKGSADGCSFLTGAPPLDAAWAVGLHWAVGYEAACGVHLWRAGGCTPVGKVCGAVGQGVGHQWAAVCGTAWDVWGCLLGFSPRSARCSLATAPHVMAVEQGLPCHPVAAEWGDQAHSLYAASRQAAACWVGYCGASSAGSSRDCHWQWVLWAKLLIGLRWLHGAAQCLQSSG